VAPFRVLNAATMLGQSKTAHQAEIDAACELIDFWRYNVAFASRLYAEQPRSPAGVWNLLDHRPLEGFVLAVSPFNFTSIAANLPTAPALLGNTVVWKPAVNATYSAHFILELLREAGLPDGVVNLVLGEPARLVEAALGHPDLAGVHFTGSTAVFQRLWATVGQHVGADRYRSIRASWARPAARTSSSPTPRADLDALAVALVRGAYEYQGQKCSAASRAYVPASLWPRCATRLTDMLAEVRVGDPTDFTTSWAP
jgi:1-pyrroline-5-carboxylate dehydrogenase